MKVAQQQQKSNFYGRNQDSYSVAIRRSVQVKSVN